MDNVFITHEFQSLQNLDGESSNQTEWNTLEVISFDELIQIDWKQLESNQQVTPEVAVILYANDVVLVVRVFCLQVLHYVQLHGGLVRIFLLVSDDLDGDGLLRLVIVAL